MITIFINNIAYYCAKNINLTILQVCEIYLTQQVPVFCYHEKLSVAANCRICLVEVEKYPKPIASCSMPIAEGMKIYTETPLVRKARESVLEFLLLNHPLDCPICDQGGECDLQDQAMIFGSDRSRFYSFKRSVLDKNVGPLIKTIMTRCIHCTRCVRFASEVLGVNSLGMTGRGVKSEIGMYIENIFESELSGNVIDLCPVGALTSKPYAFIARSWELNVTETIDITDSTGSNISIYSRNSEIIRILPRFNENINEDWISDKTRFSFDSLQSQRLDVPLIKINNELTEVSWLEAFKFIKTSLSQIDSSRICGITGDLTDLESAFSFKEFMNSMGVRTVKYHTNKPFLNSDFISNYKFNSSLIDIENCDFCLLVGANPKIEAPLLNVRLHKKFTEGTMDVAYIGPNVKTSFALDHIGLSFKIFLDILLGKHPLSKKLKQAKNPSIIFGLDFINTLNKTVMITLFNILENNISSLKKKNINILQQDSNVVGLHDLGFSSYIFNNLFKAFYLLNADKLNIPSNSFIIYEGSFWDRNAKSADVILPSLTFIEKNSIFVNLEGRPQKTNKVFGYSSYVREDWQIFRGLSESLSYSRKISVLKFDKLDSLTNLLRKKVPSILNLNFIEVSSFNFTSFLNYGSFFKISRSSFKKSIINFYRTNSISRLSLVMSKCSVFLKNKSIFKK